MKRISVAKTLMGIGMTVALTTGCSLLPEEAEIVAPPMLQSYESAAYSVFTVSRGDVLEWQNIRVTAVARFSEELAFSIGGVTISDIYVVMGDVVQAGDVLAKLESSQLERDIANTKDGLADLARRRRNTNALRALDEQAAAIRGTLAEVRRQYDATIADMNAEEEMLTITLQDLERRYALHVLTASIDGVITTVRGRQIGDNAVKDDKMFEITDRSSTMFSVTGTSAAYLAIGEKVEIEVGEVAYAATVRSAEELELPSPKEETAYLTLDDAGVIIREMTTGTVKKLMSEKKDVLFVPTSAIRTIDSGSFVYMIEDGVRVTREVEIGLRTTSETEIISGLSEGEEIISGGASR